MGWYRVGWSTVGTAEWRKMDWGDAAQGGEVRREPCVLVQQGELSDSERREQYDWTTGPHFHSKTTWPFLSLKAVVRMTWGQEENLENVEEKAELPRNKGLLKLSQQPGR